jgi:hypothetical protein
MSYAWQDKCVGRSLRTTPFFAAAIALQIVTSVLRMEKRRIAPRIANAEMKHRVGQTAFRGLVH